MTDMLRDVREFHEVMGHTVGSQLAVRDEKLRINLITEETKETNRALAQEDLVEMIDGCMDILYVTLGTLVAAGVNEVQLGAFWKEVHAANMAKLVPCEACDGTGWTKHTRYPGGASCPKCNGHGKHPLKRPEDGKIIRPIGWKEPNIAGLVREIKRNEGTL